MRKFTIYNLQFTILVSILYILHFTFYIPSALALDSTPSSEIKSKLEELKKEIASKAAKLKQEVSSKLKDKAYVGKIKSTSSTSITLATKNGPKIININQDTEYESKIKGKKYQQKLIAEEDYLSALGDVDETGVLTAKRIILLSPPSSIEKTFIWGQIISTSDKLATLKNNNGKNIAISLSGFSVKNLDFVIATGYLNKNEIFKADYVYIIPQGGVLKPNRQAGGSKQTATPAATIKPTKKPPLH